MSGSGLAYDLTDAVATFDARAIFSSTKIDNGTTVLEADCDSNTGAIWFNWVDDMFQDANAVFNGTKLITALGIGSVISGAHADANDLVVGSVATSACGITILSDQAGTGNLFFGDDGSTSAGRISYDHTNTQFEIFVEGTQWIDISATTIVDRIPTLQIYSANAALSLGHDTPGTPSITMYKSDAGTAFTSILSGGTERAKHGLDASENLILQHNTAAGAEDCTVTVGADAVTIAAATTTIGDANGRLTVASGSATFDSGTAAVTSGGLATTVRDLAANAALTLAQSDAGGSVHVHSTDTSTVAATMTGMIYGSRIRVIMRERTSTGKYTLACVYGTTSGTVTLDAQHEGVDLIYIDGVWVAELLLSGATFA